MSDPRPTYGVKEQLVAHDSIDLHVQAIRLLGHTVVEAGPDRPLSALRSTFDLVLERQVLEGGGREAMLAIGEGDTARALLAYDDAFLELAQDEVVLAICERILGSHFILNQQNAVLSPPAGAGHRQASYHRDLPYQHLVTSRPLAISALFCLDEFTAESGATFVLPASHRLEAFPDDGLVARAEQQLVAPAGSFLVFDSMLYHRAGTNRGSGPRRAVNHVYSLPILKQQIALPAVLGPRFLRESGVARLLGFESEPARSVADWIASRKARLLGKA
jgi:ectoine hydroxylase-related dioxygenase (phytanoyl-CoA dioxygenase family)